VRSWLLDLMSDAIGKNPQLDGIAPYVADSGEGRWTAKEAIDLGVSTPVMNIALYQRFTTPRQGTFRRSPAGSDPQRIRRPRSPKKLANARTGTWREL